MRPVQKAGALFQQQLHKARLFSSILIGVRLEAGRRNQCRFAIVDPGLDVSTSFQQQPHNGDVG
jgi:hypothetical protein